MKTFFPAFFLLSVVVLLPSYRPRSVVIERSALARSSNQFGFSFFHHLLKDDTANRIVSPVGVYLSLNLLYNAAARDTRDSIGFALQVSDMDIPQLNAQSKVLLQQFSIADRKARFSMANAIWCNRKKVQLTPAFEELGGTFYYSSVQAVPFNGRSTAEKINGWIMQNTGDDACPLLESADANDMVYVTNACSFNAGWKHPFDPAATQDDLFYLPDGRRVLVPFMHKLFVTRSYSDTSFSMIELPYGNGNAYSMFIVMPNNLQQSLRAFTAGFQGERLFEAVSRMNAQWVDIAIPRWEQRMDGGDMMPALDQMGMGILHNIGGRPDLSNMCTKPVNGLKNTMDLLMGKYDVDPPAPNTPVAGVFHTACFNVNENGSLVDVMPMPDSAVAKGLHRSLPFKADRPFLYFVAARQQQVVVLAGVMNNPVSGMHVMAPNGPSPSRPAGHRPPRGKERQKKMN